MHHIKGVTETGIWTVTGKISEKHNGRSNLSYAGRMVELVDTRDLKSLACNGREGSSPSSATEKIYCGVV